MENHIIFNGQDLCQFCYESETVACERCGERIWTDDDCGDATHILCRDCAECHYDRCLRYNTLIAILQMVELLCDVALCMSDNEAKALTWSGLVSNLDPELAPELIQYLKERRLYVNEPVVAEAEV